MRPATEGPQQPQMRLTPTEFATAGSAPSAVSPMMDVATLTGAATSGATETGFKP